MGRAARLIAVLAVAASSFATGHALAAGLPPEPPAPIPPATTLPTLRNTPLLPPEPVAPMPSGTTLPSMRGGAGLGAEPPAPMPPATTLPSFRGQ